MPEGRQTVQSLWDLLSDDDVPDKAKEEIADVWCTLGACLVSAVAVVTYWWFQR